MSRINLNFAQDVVVLNSALLKEKQSTLMPMSQISATKRWDKDILSGNCPNQHAASHAVEELLRMQIESCGAHYALFGQKFSVEEPDGQSGTVWQSVDLFRRIFDE